MGDKQKFGTHSSLPTSVEGTDIQIHAKQTQHVSNQLSEILAKHTGHGIEKIKQDTDRDYFLTPEEAVDYRLIDAIFTERA